MAKGELISATRLREVLHYDPETDVFTRVGPRPGSPKTLTPPRKYRHIKIKGYLYKAHRLAFLWMTGRWPEAEVDHVNLDKTDNRWTNLREAGRSGNNRNRPIYSNNKSGFKGVSWAFEPGHGRGKWRAQIRVRGKVLCLGFFDNPVQAAVAYRQAALKHHGDYAPRT